MLAVDTGDHPRESPGSIDFQEPLQVYSSGAAHVLRTKFLDDSPRELFQRYHCRWLGQPTVLINGVGGRPVYHHPQCRGYALQRVEWSAPCSGCMPKFPRASDFREKNGRPDIAS